MRFAVVVFVSVAMVSAVPKGETLWRLSREQNFMGRHFQKHKFDFFLIFYPDSKIFCKAQQNIKSTSRLLIVN